jgi:hypothetical protein
MRIIALRGGDSCGKTATLNLVYDRLLLPLNGGISTGKKQVGGDKRDFSDIVNYKGLTVAFFTMGDIARDTKNAIHFYDSLKVDVLVIASNTKFSTPINLIVSYTHDLVIKTIAIPSNPTNDLIANTTDANTIFGLI